MPFQPFLARVRVSYSRFVTITPEQFPGATEADILSHAVERFSDDIAALLSPVSQMHVEVSRADTTAEDEITLNPKG